MSTLCHEILNVQSSNEHVAAGIARDLAAVFTTTQADTYSCKTKRLYVANTCVLYYPCVNHLFAFWSQMSTLLYPEFPVASATTSAYLKEARSCELPGTVQISKMTACHNDILRITIFQPPFLPSAARCRHCATKF